MMYEVPTTLIGDDFLIISWYNLKMLCGGCFSAGFIFNYIINYFKMKGKNNGE